MTLPNLTPQGADVALDPMAGTLADSFERVPYSVDTWARDGAQTSTISPESRANAGSGVAHMPGANFNILALDLGTKAGYALRRRDGAMRYGTVDFTPRKSWTLG